MSMHRWMRSCKFAGLALVALAGTASAQNRDVPGPIDSLQDLQDTGRMVFKVIDENNDGQISQPEAIDAVNGIIGGLFFRADANGDGTLSRDEMQAARQKLMQQKPVVRMVVQQLRTSQNPGGAEGAQANATQNAARGLMSLIDSNNDGNLQATELRQMVQTSVQSGFAAADTNRDGQLSPAEVNSAIVGAAKASAQAAFQRADTDQNGQLSRAEFDKALVEPANVLFQAMDLNHDNQLSPQEAQAARRFVVSQVRRLDVPEPPNSPRNLLESGRRPAEVAPVPTFNPNTNPGESAPPVQPVRPGTAPAPVPAPGVIPR